VQQVRNSARSWRSTSPSRCVNNLPTTEFRTNIHVQVQRSQRPIHIPRHEHLLRPMGGPGQLQFLRQKSNHGAQCSPRVALPPAERVGLGNDNRSYASARCLGVYPLRRGGPCCGRSPVRQAPTGTAGEASSVVVPDPVLVVPDPVSEALAAIIWWECSSQVGRGGGRGLRKHEGME
jgi:hypothetical protein